MDMRRVGLFVLAIVAVTCGPSRDAKLPGYENLHANGGTTDGSGGSAGSGGTTHLGSGGTVTGSGGTVTGSGGRPPGTGGRGTGGTIPDGTGGQGPGTGGRTGGTGGIAGRDGGAGGVPGTGGTSTARDASPRDTAGSCYATLVDNGYACGSAAPCSACKVNNVSKEAECQKGIDCLAAAGASCDSNCVTNCLNQAGDAQVGACITALTKLACGTGC